MTPERRRELAEKAYMVLLRSPHTAVTNLESAFLDLEKEVRESAIDECITYLAGSTFQEREIPTVQGCIALLRSLKERT
jgi:hypothetical protein